MSDNKETPSIDYGKYEQWGAFLKDHPLDVFGRNICIFTPDEKKGLLRMVMYHSKYAVQLFSISLPGELISGEYNDKSLSQCDYIASFSHQLHNLSENNFVQVIKIPDGYEQEIRFLSDGHMFRVDAGGIFARPEQIGDVSVSSEKERLEYLENQFCEHNPLDSKADTEYSRNKTWSTFKENLVSATCDTTCVCLFEKSNEENVPDKEPEEMLKVSVYTNGAIFVGDVRLPGKLVPAHQENSVQQGCTIEALLEQARKYGFISLKAIPYGLKLRQRLGKFAYEISICGTTGAAIWSMVPIKKSKEYVIQEGGLMMKIHNES